MKIALVLAASAVPAAAFAGASIDAARAALRDGMWKIAAEQAALAIEQGDRPLEATLALAEAHDCAGNAAKALETLDSAPPGIKDSPEALFRKAAILAKTGRDREAAECVAPITAAPGDDPRTSAVKSRALRFGAAAAQRAGLAGAAERLFAQAAECAALAGAEEAASTAVERASFLASSPDGAERALAVLDASGAAAQTGTPGDAARLLRGSILETLGRNGEAVREYAALTSEPGTAPHEFVQASLRLASLGSPETVALLRKAAGKAETPADKAAAGIALGLALAREPDTRREGVAAVNKTAFAFPDDPASARAIVDAADILFAAGEYEDAAAEYLVCLESFPGSPDTLHSMAGRALAFAESGKTAEALSLLKRGADLSKNESDKAMLAAKQGEVLAGAGRFAEAAGRFAEASLHAAGTPFAQEAKFRMANALFRSGRARDAIAAWREIEDSGGSFADESALHAGFAESSTGKWREAEDAYSRILARRPAGAGDAIAAEARIRRGSALYRALKFKEAMTDFEEAQADETHIEAGRYGCAMCLLNLGRDEEARKTAADALKSCKEDSPWRARFLLWLGKFDFAARSWNEAAAEFAEFAKLRPDSTEAPDTLFWAARCAFESSDFPLAAERAAKMIAAYPAAPAIHEARILQASALKELSRFEEAVLVLRSVSRSADPPASPDAAARASLLAGDCLCETAASNPRAWDEALAAYRSVLSDKTISPAMSLSASFRAAKTLEKLSRTDEAAEEYYNGVFMKFSALADQGTLVGEAGQTAFVRAAIALADYHESRGLPDRAAAVLRHAAAKLPGAADELAGRAKKLEAKGYAQ